MFYIFKIIINIFISLMCCVGGYFTYKEIINSDDDFYLIIKLIFLIGVSVCFFIFAIKYYFDYKK